MDVTVIIRSAGERTRDLCYALACQESDQRQVRLIEESPFSRAVRRTFELGIEAGRRWTVAIDADVLIRRHAIRDLVERAEKSPDSIFELEGRIWDKLFGGPRSGGLHLYRTEFLPRALSIADEEKPVNRPELRVITKMMHLGFTQQRHQVTVGLHDFEQYSRDYFRKGVSFARKFADQMWFLEPMWRRRVADDSDIAMVLRGLEHGRRCDGPAITDRSAFGGLSNEFSKGGTFEEKGDLQVDLDLDTIARMMDEFTPEPEFLVWDAWLAYENAKCHATQYEVEGLRNRLSRAGVQLTPPIIISALRRLFKPDRD